MGALLGGPGLAKRSISGDDHPATGRLGALQLQLLELGVVGKELLASLAGDNRVDEKHQLVQQA